MHQFICNAVGGKIVPLQPDKEKFLLKLLNSYQDLNKKFKVTIEIIEKPLSNEQVKLYHAFVFKASKHFGNTFMEMSILLTHLHPQVGMEGVNWPKDVSKWTTDELDTFINQASTLLAEQGFIFN